MTSAPGARVGRTLQCICRCAAGDLRRLPATPGQSIHALRVRMKKLRALLRLAGSQLSKASRRRLRQRMRDVKNAFTTTRETIVLEKLARRMRRRHGLPKMQLRPAAAADTLPLTRVKRTLASLRAELAALPLNSLTIEDLLAAYAACCRSCRRGLKRCRKSPVTAGFHRWRKRVKEWYFLSLTLHELPSARACIRPAEQLGHWLGEEHDLALLSDRIGGPSAKAWRTVLARSTAHMRRRILAKAKKMPFMHPGQIRRRLAAEAAR